MRSLGFSGGVYLYHVDLTDETSGKGDKSLVDGEGFGEWHYKKIHTGRSTDALDEELFLRDLKARLQTKYAAFESALFRNDVYPFFVLLVELGREIKDTDISNVNRFRREVEDDRRNFPPLIIFISRFDAKRLESGAVDLVSELDSNIRPVFFSGNIATVNPLLIDFVKTFHDGCNREAEIRNVRFRSLNLWAAILLVFAPVFIAIVGKLTEKWFDWYFAPSQSGSKPSVGGNGSKPSYFSFQAFPEVVPSWMAFSLGVLVGLFFLLLYSIDLKRKQKYKELLKANLLATAPPS
jgi:hypothetical protein